MKIQTHTPVRFAAHNPNNKVMKALQQTYEQNQFTVSQDYNNTTADVTISERSLGINPRVGMKIITVSYQPQKADQAAFQKLIALTENLSGGSGTLKVSGKNMVSGTIQGALVEVRMDPQTP